MVLTRRETILLFDEMKKKFGDTQKFKDFEEKYEFDINFIKFMKKHRLQYNKITGWNKQFLPIIQSVWIKKKPNWNKELRKHGYYQNIIIGWRMNDHVESFFQCKWCGTLLKGKQTKFCSNESHKKLFSKVIGIGKKRHGFDLNKNFHMLIIPRLWEYDTNEKGTLIIKRTKTKRIESKNIEFSINGKRYPLTAKSRTPSKQKLT